MCTDNTTSSNKIDNQSMMILLHMRPRAQTDENGAEPPEAALWYVILT